MSSQAASCARLLPGLCCCQSFGRASIKMSKDGSSDHVGLLDPIRITCLPSRQWSWNDRHHSCCMSLQPSLSNLATDSYQQALSNASVHDFLIIEYNGEIGGRVAHTTFGNSSAAKSYTVELGANWVRLILLIRLKLTCGQVQGLQTGNGPENPIWFLVRTHHLPSL